MLFILVIVIVAVSGDVSKPLATGKYSHAERLPPAEKADPASGLSAPRQAARGYGLVPARRSVTHAPAPAGVRSNPRPRAIAPASSPPRCLRPRAREVAATVVRRRRPTQSGIESSLNASPGSPLRLPLSNP